MDEKEESAAMKEDGPKEKSTLKAYLWFLVGGFVGAHHMYLGNDYQAVLMISTVGGCYGLGGPLLKQILLKTFSFAKLFSLFICFNCRLTNFN